MGKQKLFFLKSHFVYMSKKMAFIVRVLWVSCFTSLFTLFDFLARQFYRLQEKSIARSSSITQVQQECYASKFGIEEENSKESGSLLRFRFPTFEEFARNNDVYVVSNQVCHSSDDDCPLVETSSMVSKFVDDIVEPQISSDVNMIVNHDKDVSEPQISTENSSEMIHKLVEKIVDPQICTENNASSHRDICGRFFDFKNEDSESELMSVPVNVMEENLKELRTESREEPSKKVHNIGNSVHSVSHTTHFLSNDDSFVLYSDSDSMVSSNSSYRSSFSDSLSDEFLDDIDFQTEYGWKEVKPSSDLLTEEDIELQNLSKGYGNDFLGDEDEDLLLELKYIEDDLEDNVHSFVSEDGIHEKSMPLSESVENQKVESNLVDANNTKDTAIGTNMESNLLAEHQSLVLDLVNDAIDINKMDNESESKHSSEKSSSDSDEQNGLEREWEHQDLVEQLKMEIRKVRAIGLPTILEESESPKLVDDLKPWKIEQKYQHDGTMDELHMFYKSYRERMRKLDILNFQKMYAIGFLRQEDPLQSFTKNKLSVPALSAIVSFDCWPCKPKQISEIHEPLVKKFSRELVCDLEMVYVGQMCLSWEFLCWEYGKALDIWESDPHGTRCYNEVADKFQMFQVLITRFLENEPFKGPRVQHYVKERCVLRNLLQVPVVQDDNYKDRKKERKVISNKDSFTILQVVEIIEESIRVLWQLIRTDKESSNAALLKSRRSATVELQSPVDASLLEDVQSTLQKKDKKLKELTRSENCILRRFRKHQEDGSYNVVHFFSQVSIKLVARVKLNHQFCFFPVHSPKNNKRVSNLGYIHACIVIVRL